ncbi:MAG TPA: agmatine deiminase family protein [Blastocatellia bacterium]|nr:agmatine deiminase family protein [Blastocatellia bacterium]
MSQKTERAADSSPSSMGFRMPAEWEPHEATWIGWPHNRTDWPGKFTTIPWVYGEIVRKLAPGELVRIIVNSEAHEARARRVLSRVGVDPTRVEFFRFATRCLISGMSFSALRPWTSASALGSSRSTAST